MKGFDCAGLDYTEAQIQRAKEEIARESKLNGVWRGGKGPKRPRRALVEELSADTRPPEFSDEALALRFAERHRGDLRFVAKWGKWLEWTGTHWRFDDTRHVVDCARRICREAASACGLPRTAKGLASRTTANAVEQLASADRRLASTADHWDADPWLLNTPDGVIDLRTGQMRGHRPEDHMTKITASGPRGPAPRFLAFLDRIAGGDRELVSYLQRVLGYALTGSTREHALFFAYGTGANGKSVLLSTVSGLLATYHKAAPMEAFVTGGGDRHPTDLAGLCGARLVTAIETEEGARWSEARIKQLTGGDVVAARFMRQDFFEYRPAYKLIIAGNRKPALRSVDEAMRRRLHLIPFSVTIPPDERDDELTEKLKDEWPGILAWLVEGTLEWQAEGLRPPLAVAEATGDYLSSEDTIAAWIEDRCELRKGAWASSTHLYRSYSAWAEAAGEERCSQRKFSQKLELAHFERKRTGKAKGFVGLHVIPDDPGGAHWSDL